MDAWSPPPYRRHSRQGQASQSGSELPRYTRRNTLVHTTTVREPTQHVFSLSDGRPRPWLVLQVSSSAKSAKVLPTFYEKEKINATLELRADKGDSSIQSVIAMIRGRVITGPRPDETVTFMTIVHPIWARSADTPRMPSPSQGTNGSKLVGDCVWSFSIPLPKTVALGSDTQFRLPETFSEREVAASVQYDLTIHVSRGKLRADSQIRTPFGYIPSSKPEQPPSMLRQIAFQSGYPAPGPSADPRGWKTLRTCKATGTFLKNCPADVQCSLSLAMPLCYIRGSVIPCFISLSCRNPQALDMITAANCIDVRLQRTVGYSCAPGIEKKKVSYQESVREFAKAVWSPSATMQSDPCNRHLEGEIRIPKDLKPTSLMDHFSVSYSIILRSFDVSGLRSSNSEILLSEPVDIVTTHVRSRPIAYAPPAYEPHSRENDSDYR